MPSFLISERCTVRFSSAPPAPVGASKSPPKHYCGANPGGNRVDLWYTRDEIESFKSAVRNHVSVQRRDSFTAIGRIGRDQRLSNIHQGIESVRGSCNWDGGDDDGDNNGGNATWAAAAGDDKEEEKGEQVDDTSFSVPRGIEHRVSPDRRRRKYVALRSVLEFQRKLRQAAVVATRKGGATAVATLVDPAERLARYARRCTAWAGGVALATGQSDFLEVYPYMARTVYRSGSAATTAVVVSRTATASPPPPSRIIRGRKRKQREEKSGFYEVRTCRLKTNILQCLPDCDYGVNISDCGHNVQTRAGCDEQHCATATYELGPDPELREFLRVMFEQHSP